jgi:phage terminase large subunit-like protein
MAASDYYFDEEAAERVVWFIETYLQHTKGEFAGQPFVLEEWQRQATREIFGWKRRSDGTRRYRRVLLYVPRKNGKSTWGSALAAYALFADGERGADVFSAAADRDQAGIVFEQTKDMVRSSARLMKQARVYKRAITVEKTMSSYKVLSSDVKTKHGLNPHLVVFDELHTQPTRELWDTLTTAQGSRQQPLVIALTTAGYEPESIEAEIYEYAVQVRDGVIEDETFYPLIYEAAADADWQDPAVWAAANPNYGVSLKPEYMAEEARRAANSPAYINTFKRLLLNIRTAQRSKWFPLEVWDACRAEFDEKSLEGRTCYGGLDLANTSDLASLVLLFPDEETGAAPYRVLPFFWLPAENVVERQRQQQANYEAWIRDGFVRATPGNVIDHAVITRDIEELAERFNIVDIAFDRWGSVQVSNQLAGAGLVMVEFGQGYASMSAPAKELYRLLNAGGLQHNGHPVLRWNADNVVVDQDPAGNLKPNKTKARRKIDGVVALLMALGRAMRHDLDEESVYETRGIELI